MRRLRNGKFVTVGYEHEGYEIRNHGYYPPDRRIWWEAINTETGEADFHAHRLRDIRALIDGQARYTHPDNG